MKKFIGLTMALAFGFFLVSVEAQRQQDPRMPQDQQERQQQQQHQQQAQHMVPVEKNDLPEEVVETIENEFDDWNFQQAFRVTGEYPGMEGAEGTEGIEQREGAAERADQQYFMIQLEKDGEFKTVHISEDGEKLEDHKDKDKDEKRGRQRNY